MTLQHLRSSTANKRPLPAGMSDGQLAINTNTTSPGLFFKDSAGELVKLGPVHVGTAAPNASPASGGATGNSTGELWLDTSLTPNELKTWNGSAWISATGQEIPVSKLIDGDARQLLQTDAAGTGVEWTSNVDVPGTLDVTSTATFDSIASHPLGSAGAPTITFTGDTNTGIYSPGADQIALSTNGTGRLFVDSAGLVGVGTSSPDSPLHVSSSTTGILFQAHNPTGVPGSQARSYLGASSLLPRQRGVAFVAELNDDSSHNLQFWISTTSGAGPTEKMRITNTGRVGIGTTSPDSLLHLNSNSTSAGNGGLRIATADSNESYVTVGVSTSLDTAFISSLQNGSGSARPLSFVVGTSSTQERMRITSDGKVGIGTTAPEELVHINASSSGALVDLLKLDNGGGAVGTEAGIVFECGTDRTARISSANTGSDLGALKFWTAGSADTLSERARIDSSGRLLVGTSSARSNIRIDGNNYALQTQIETAGSTYANGLALIHNSSAGYAPVLSLATSAGTTVGSNTLVANGTELGRIVFSGSDGTNFVNGATILAAADGATSGGDLPSRLVFSTTKNGQASPTEAVRIDADQLFYSVPSYNSTTAAAANLVVESGGKFRRSTSSGKYKTNVEPLQDAYADALLSCRPVWYRSTCTGDNPSWGWWGFIAEEVAAIDPRLVHWKTVEVTYDEKGSAVSTPCDPEPEGVAYDRFVPHLLNLIKRQKEQIEAMEARLSALEGA